MPLKLGHPENDQDGTSLGSTFRVVGDQGYDLAVFGGLRPSVQLPNIDPVRVSRAPSLGVHDGNRWPRAFSGSNFVKCT
ncbi:hypothetical protein Cob_v007767 [Colletotrichum orbiculare MAFF 240422]|uniref:Uncharacterized protein n=1 Tax=Colletotrichum orbiculare (strain 104-T / ATCC 96160 / CBS 514.97 / LARS 414 / MAFF 240422) TaxID=1213857 RepID=A0A484FP35_COLOR|nr:hypothetical protein Cob_v007767 [Colletotrichum orbiculare MAFF 240422]